MACSCGALVAAVPLIAALYAPEPPPEPRPKRYSRGGVNDDGGYESEAGDSEYAGNLIVPVMPEEDPAFVFTSPGAWTHWLTLIGTGGASRSPGCVFCICE